MNLTGTMLMSGNTFKLAGMLSLAALVAISTPNFTMAAEKPATISVTGTGSASVAPDMAIVSFGVIREAKTAREALTANNKAMKEVLTSMKAAGIADKDLQTSNFNIQPRYIYSKPKNNGEQKPPKIVGYVVSNNLTVRIRDLENTGAILDLVVSLGVNTGGNIRFTNQDKKSVLEMARVAAVKDAMAKAKLLTETAGAGLGKILSISENSHQPNPRPIAYARAAKMADSAESVPIASGENTYNVHVNISWEIDQ